MGRLTKRDIKVQRNLYNTILTGITGTYWEKEEIIDMIYEEFNPAIVNNISENGVFFTPYGLAQDVAVFSNRRGHIVDVCAGIGMLSYRIHQMDSYNKDIKSITCIELDEKFVEIGKKLLPQANWICANVFDQDLWDGLVKDLPDKRFDFMVSNPPFGRDMNKYKADFLKFSGERDLQALELCLKYAKGGYFVMPQGSVNYTYSGRPYYEDKPERWSNKFKRFMKATKNDYKFSLSCDGIDSSIYKDQWKNIDSITVEAADVQVWPYSLDYEEDALSIKYATIC